MSNNKMSEFVEVTIPGDSTPSGTREVAWIHYTQFIFAPEKNLCYVNFCGKWVMPNEMNMDIINRIRRIG